MCDAPVTEKKRKIPSYYKPAAVLASLAVIGLSVHLFSLTQRTITAGTEKNEGAAETTVAAAAVSEFGMLLRDSEWRGTSSYETVIELASGPVINDEYKEGFVKLVRMAGKR